MAGLTTDAPNAGPPVVFTICAKGGHHGQRPVEEEGEMKDYHQSNLPGPEAQRWDAGLVERRAA